MSKASIAQEPSMDEILASIRRIIETGDEKAPGGSREAAVGAARQIPAFLAGAPIHDLGDAHVEPVSARSDPLRFPAEPASPVPLHGAESGDDDALTAELETELAATWERIETDRDRDEAPLPVVPPEGDRLMNARSEAMSSEPDTHPYAGPADAVAFHSDAEGNATRAPAAAHPTNSYEAPMERSSFEPANTDARAQGEGPAASSRYGDTPPPLVSPATGQLVGASFNELAEAIRQGELRSLEAMAQEMLQPMLRDWLDDNLPKMVERLIREEIERLARGGAKR